MPTSHPSLNSITTESHLLCGFLTAIQETLKRTNFVELNNMRAISTEEGVWFSQETFFQDKNAVNRIPWVTPETFKGYIDPLVEVKLVRKAQVGKVTYYQVDNNKISELYYGEKIEDDKNK